MSRLPAGSRSVIATIFCPAMPMSQRIVSLAVATMPFRMVRSSLSIGAAYANRLRPAIRTMKRACHRVAASLRISNMPATDRMLATREGAIGWITFNNPARRNAVSFAMWQALGEMVRSYAEDASVRAIVLRGAGEEAFVSGADISEFEEKRSSAETTAA